MLKIIIAKINLFSEQKINIRLNKTYILTLAKDIFTITSDKTLKYILGIKNPLYLNITDKLIQVKDIKKGIIYNIEILNIISQLELNNENIISDNKKSIYLEEFDIKDYIINNFNKIFPGFKILQTEYVTPYGNIDILAINNEGIYQIIELKKKSTDFKTIDQVSKYGYYFDENDKDNNLYVVGVNENNKNKEYALNKNVKIISINKKDL